MTQAKAIKLMHSGANIFLTGEPGAGKTYTLNQFIEQALLLDQDIAEFDRRIKSIDNV